MRVIYAAVQLNFTNHFNLVAYIVNHNFLVYMNIYHETSIMSTCLKWIYTHTHIRTIHFLIAFPTIIMQYVAVAIEQKTKKNFYGVV